MFLYALLYGMTFVIWQEINLPGIFQKNIKKMNKWQFFLRVFFHYWYDSMINSIFKDIMITKRN